MGDEFDGCECVWSHAYAMQRLLAFIRQNQNNCTDHYCVDASDNLRQSNSISIPSDVEAQDDTNSIMMTMLMVFFLVLYLIRPQSLMSFKNTGKRGGGPDADGNGGSSLPPSQPPPAPPATN
uniref:Small integral membrane protein 14 n=1 Tax=Glossina palpalis gambiensis TaxID=67801 RepID=A0A1B0BH52_9MUSC